MPEIELTDDQYEYLEDLRDDLEAELVGPYGHVRLSDAVQYLIDDHEGVLDEILDDTADEATGDGTDVNDATEANETTNGGTDDEADESDTAGKTDDSDGSDAKSSSDAEVSGGDRLSVMMKLLDTHDDKWREADGEARYEVDLPDGTTEPAPTKDDVRALLFKNYENDARR